MMNTFIKELRQRFYEDRHIFYFINQCPLSEKSLFDYGDVFEMTGKNAREKAMHLKKYADMSDYIIWHGMIYDAKKVLFASMPSILNKSIWLIWGIDLYNWRVDDKSFKNKLKNRINIYWRKHVRAIITLMPLDEKAYKTAFKKSKAKCYNIPYPISYEGFETMDKMRDAKPRQNGKLFIQIAHNAHPFNNHEEILNYLSKFANENIEVYVPLSYGPEDKKEYIDKVIKQTTLTFYGKAKCIHKLMPFDKYMHFMWNMDVAVFYAHRQNALGNITRQLYMGNKVFLSPKSPTYQYLKDEGIEVYNTEDIPNMSFEEFSRKESNQKARQWVIDTYLPDNVFVLWEKMLKELGGHGIGQNYNVVDHHINEEQNAPLFKENIPTIYKYLKWPKDVSESKSVVIIGSTACCVDFYLHLLNINRTLKSERYHLLGFLNTHEEVVDSVLESLDLGYYKNYNYDQCDLIYCLESNNRERSNIFDYLTSKGETISSLTPSSLSAFVKIAGSDILFGETKVGILTKIGLGLIAFDTCFGRECIIDNFIFTGRSVLVQTGVHLGDYVTLQYKVTVGAFSEIGKNTEVMVGTTVGFGTFIGENCKIQQQCDLGNVGQSFEWKPNDYYLTIGDNVTIGSNVVISKNVLIGNGVTIGRDTLIESGVVIEDGAKIGANVVIRKNARILKDMSVDDNSVIE